MTTENTEKTAEIFLSAAERDEGTLVEVDVGEQTVLVEVPAGTAAGAVLRVRTADGMLRVTVREREWGIADDARLDLAPRAGSVDGDSRFWQRVAEEIVESRRSGIELAGAVYVEKRERSLVLTGLSRRAVAPDGALMLDPSWGSLLWRTRSGTFSGLSAFSDAEAAQAKSLKRPVLWLGHTLLSPTVAASLVFPVGARTLALAAGLKGLLALDRHRRGDSLLLGWALVARIIYPDGSVHPVGHLGASLPRELFDRAAFEADRSVGEAGNRAGRFLRDFVQAAVTGRTGRGR